MKIGVLISGRGSNLQSLIDAQQAGDLSAEIVLVISNVPGVHGLERAEAAGIPTKVINHKDFEDRGPFEDALHAALTEAGVDWQIMMYGHANHGFCDLASQSESMRYDEKLCMQSYRIMREFLSESW